MTEEIYTIEEFDKRFFPENCKKYPITLRVNKEEQDLILRRRGNRWIESPIIKKGA